MLLYNCHTHTCFSHDSSQNPEEYCITGREKGLFGFAVTDHLDCEYYENPATESNIDASYGAACALKEKYRGKILVSAGVELGDALFCPSLARKMTEKHPWDVILLSVHAVRMKDWDMPFSTIDFSDRSAGFIDDYLNIYFNDLYETVNSFDYDVLSHLTVPLRYIVKKYGKNVCTEEYYGQIEKILACVAKEGKALEINTSGVTEDELFLMPGLEILEMFKACGGDRISIGSDAHISHRLTNGLKETASLLAENGYRKITYYSGRKPVDYYIGGTRDDFIG